MNKYFVVAEGQTDFEIISAVIEEVLRPLGIKSSIERLFPPDATPAGWSNLKTWCKAQAAAGSSSASAKSRAAIMLGARLPLAQPTAANTTAPVVSDRISAALMLQSGQFKKVKIIFQLDSDVAECFCGDITVPSHVSFPLNAADREVIAEHALDSWLGHHKSKRGQSIEYCVATHAIETFMLAIHDPAVVAAAIGIAPLPSDYDKIVGPDLALVALGYPKRTRNGKTSIRKKVELYKHHAAQFRPHFNAAKARSSSLTKFCGVVP